MNAETIQRMQLADDLGEDEQPRTYVFTFGAEHAYDGISLRDRYVRFHGTYMEARLKMIAAFGQKWCAQYDSPEDAGVAKYRLTELVLPDPSRETT